MKKFLTALLIGGIFMTGTAEAEIVTYEGEGQYLMSDFETPDIAKLRAKERAEKSAQEKAGIFVKSNVKVVNLQLESEEIEVMTAGIMKSRSVTYDVQASPSGFLFTSKVSVDIDSDEIDKWLQKSVVEKEELIELISTLGIDKEDGGTEKEYTYLDRRYYDVPNVVGMSVSDAKKELKNFKVEYSGSGNVVIYQTPRAGERILGNETIRLLVGE